MYTEVRINKTLRCIKFLSVCLLRAATKSVHREQIKIQVVNLMVMVIELIYDGEGERMCLEKILWCDL